MRHLAVPFRGRMLGLPFRMFNGGNGAPANPLASVPWVAQWKFNNNGNDSVGSNNLTNNNSATFATGLLGGATGATQLVRASSQSWSVADNTVLSTGNVDFLLSVYFYLDTDTNSMAICAKGSGDSSSGYEYGLYFVTATKRVRWLVGNGSSIQSVDASTFGGLSTATWYNAVGWHDSTGTIGVAVNAVSNTAARTVTPADTDKVFYVGAIGTEAYFNGRVDGICFAKGSGAVPTQTILDALYNTGAGTEGLT